MNQQQVEINHPRNQVDLQGKKILFANFPADGHFNPLTGIAVYLQSQGAEVRWYTSAKYSEAITKLSITHYGLKKAKDVAELEQLFPERDQIKGQVKKLNFDIIHAFVERGPEYFADLQEIHKTYPFEVVVADCAFTGIPFIREKMNIPVVAIGVFPLTESSVDLPPAGLGMTPSKTVIGKLKQRFLNVIADKILFRKANNFTGKLLAEYGIDSFNTNVFNLMVKKANLFLQSGTPGFEYYRSDLGSNIRFIGPLLPYQSKRHRKLWFDPRLNQFQKVVVVTQGTVERDIEKILVPTLEAFKDSGVLVIATTGGSGTAELKERFPQKNLIIEDFIPFADVMPYADAYITNGGYGGVMLGIGNQLPLVVAGVHEGKNEINARIGYFKLGVNLKTENPTPLQMRKAVEEVIKNETYKENVVKLGKEFSGYQANELTAWYLSELLRKNKTVIRNKEEDYLF